MANRYMQQFYYSAIKGLTGIHGTISLASGTSGVTSTSIIGATAARTGVGEITITLSDTYPALVSANFSLLSATAQDRVPQMESQDVSSAKTIVVNLLAAGTATDPASACTLYVDIILRNSTATR